MIHFILSDNEFLHKNVFRTALILVAICFLSPTTLTAIAQTTYPVIVDDSGCRIEQITNDERDEFHFQSIRP